MQEAARFSTLFFRSYFSLSLQYHFFCLATANVCGADRVSWKSSVFEYKHVSLRCIWVFLPPLQYGPTESARAADPINGVEVLRFDEARAVQMVSKTFSNFFSTPLPIYPALDGIVSGCGCLGRVWPPNECHRGRSISSLSNYSIPSPNGHDTRRCMFFFYLENNGVVRAKACQ